MKSRNISCVAAVTESEPSECGVSHSYVRLDISRHFRKKREHLKDTINELEINSKNKNITDLCRPKA
jgi:hypothetical protein